MSVKAKIQALINQAEIVKNAWWNIPTDIRVPDSLTQEDFENSGLACGLFIFAKSIYAKNVTSIHDNTFFGGSETIELLDLPNVDTIGERVFYGNKAMKTVILGSLIDTQPKSFQIGVLTKSAIVENLTIGKNTTADVCVHYLTKLTQESLHGIIENLADRTGQTAGVFQAGGRNLEKIDSEHLAMLENKNWLYQ